ncbi:hypothetical protein COTS27_00283 [Spirochaetota bacterium]|nr:hypothetical protein COTS27_00283 [Spirochaetota bacterium]
MTTTWTVPLFIYIAKILELALNSIRIVSIAKGFKRLSIAIAFVEGIIWILIVTRIIANIDNLFNVAAFGLGMATGVYIGGLIEEKLALGLVLVRVITQRTADKLLTRLRAAGFRVTDVPATSNYGSVKVMFATIKRKDLQNFTKLVKQFNPYAFFTVEEIKSASRTIMPPQELIRTRFSLLSLIPFKKQPSTASNNLRHLEKLPEQTATPTQRHSIKRHSAPKQHSVKQRYSAKEQYRKKRTSGTTTRSKNNHNLKNTSKKKLLPK